MPMLINPSFKKENGEAYPDEELIGAILIALVLRDKKLKSTITDDHQRTIISRLRRNYKKYESFKQGLPSISWDNIYTLELKFCVRIHVYEQIVMKCEPKPFRQSTMLGGTDIFLISRKKLSHSNSSLRYVFIVISLVSSKICY